MTPVPAKVLAAVRCIVDGPKPCPAPPPDEHRCPRCARRQGDRG